jgi:uncharacterized cupin superfamily protein
VDRAIAHWDEVDSGRGETGHLGGEWSNLGTAAGTKTVGLKRIRVDPGKWSTPYHRQTAEEEIFYVLGGSGICLQDDGAFAINPGDCIVHLRRRAHTLRAGDEGLDVLAFGTRGSTEIGHLPRAGVAWIGGTWTDVGGGEHPWEREVAAGEPELPALSERPGNVVNVDELEGESGGQWKPLAKPAGAELTGLNWGRLYEGEEGAPPHCHSADEELFVMLEGEGTLELWPSPQHARGGREYEEQPVRAGHVVSRPASTGISHRFRAGESGLTYLSYGTRNPNDVCYYPRSNKIYFRGLGLIARLEDLEYDDGEPRS